MCQAKSGVAYVSFVNHPTITKCWHVMIVENGCTTVCLRVDNSIAINRIALLSLETGGNIATLKANEF